MNDVREKSETVPEIGQKMLLSPFVILPNLGMNVMFATISGATRVAAKMVSPVKKRPMLGMMDTFMNRVSSSTEQAALNSRTLADSGFRRLVGGSMDTSMNQLLAATVLERGTYTAAMPLLTALDGVAAAVGEPSIKQALIGLGMGVSRVMDTVEQILGRDDSNAKHQTHTRR